MAHLDIFILGLLIMGLTVAAVALVGIQEAGDPEHSRGEDLSNWEKKWVDRPDVSNQESSDP